jgi:hypothetical protein
MLCSMNSLQPPVNKQLKERQKYQKQFVSVRIVCGHIRIARELESGRGKKGYC